MQRTNFSLNPERLRERAGYLQGAVGPEPYPEPDHLVEAVALFRIETLQDFWRCGHKVDKYRVPVLLQSRTCSRRPSRAKMSCSAVVHVSSSSASLAFRSSRLMIPSM